MKTLRIKILKDTPFDKQGTHLSVTDFRQKYSYVCQSSVKDQELIDYLHHENELAKEHPEIQKGISEWFEVKEFPESMGSIRMPLEFIHNGILFSKQMDGFFHQFVVGTEIIPENSIGTVMVPDAFKLYKEAKYRRLIPYLATRTNIKLGGL